jgi:hypothetical protein
MGEREKEKAQHTIPEMSRNCNLISVYTFTAHKLSLHAAAGAAAAVDSQSEIHDNVLLLVLLVLWGGIYIHKPWHVVRGIKFKFEKKTVI